MGLPNTRVSKLWSRIFNSGDGLSNRYEQLEIKKFNLKISLIYKALTLIKYQ